MSTINEKSSKQLHLAVVLNSIPLFLVIIGIQEFTEIRAYCQPQTSQVVRKLVCTVLLMWHEGTIACYIAAAFGQDCGVNIAESENVHDQIHVHSFVWYCVV